MLAKVAKMPDIQAVFSPYTSMGARQVSTRTARSRTRGTSPARAHDPISAAKKSSPPPESRDGELAVELGGAAIQDAGGRPKTGLSELVGIIAAGVVIFLAFGSLLAMLLPILSALIAIGTGLSFVGLLSHVFHIAEFGPTLAALIGLGVGVDYALFIVSRHRANLRRGMDVRPRPCSPSTPLGGPCIFAGVTVCIALLGLFTSVSLPLRAGRLSGDRRRVHDRCVDHLLPALLGFFGRRC